jgi:aspartyl-tRNA(Asn)/glutamyl-tRNA(Gln) amidotransferase subunit C
MTKISREEVLKIAKISHFALREDEIEPMIKQLEEVLSYAERVKEVAAEIEEPSNKNVNFFREDVVLKTDSKKALSQAPSREEDYFVVPSILDKK